MKRTLLVLFVFISINSFSQGTTFTPAIVINAQTGSNPLAIDSGDLDADLSNPSDVNKSIDIVIGTYFGSTIEWYKNDGNGNFTIQPLVSSTLTGIYDIEIADLNGDNYNDILAASYAENKLVWYANDGAGGFGSEQIISNTFNGAFKIIAGKIDDDSTIDIAAIAYNSGAISWYANDGAPWTELNIKTTPASAPTDFDLKDIDNDGDLDITVAYAGSGVVELYYNPLDPPANNPIVFFEDTNNPVSSGNSGGLYDVSIADVDDDGFPLDIIKADYNGNVAWYEKEGDGTFTETIINIADQAVPYRPSNARIADLDNDMHNDIIVSNAITVNDDIIWMESNDDDTFMMEVAIDATQFQVYDLTINDFDDDGDLDIASISYQDNDQQDSSLNLFLNNKIILGVSSNSIDIIKIHPNPVKDKLNFKGSFIAPLNISIYNILGKKIYDKTIELNSGLDVSNLQSGFYIIKFEGFNDTYKLVKE